MVVFDQVAEFGDDHVVNQRLAYLDQLEIERHRIICTAATPTRLYATNCEIGCMDGQLPK